jgi:hypothetical protein
MMNYLKVEATKKLIARYLEKVAHDCYVIEEDSTLLNSLQELTS